MNVYEALAGVVHSMMHDPEYDPETVMADARNSAAELFGEYDSKDKTAFLLACGVPENRLDR